MAVIRKVALISYLDTVPFIYGIRHGLDHRVELLLTTASESIRLFREGEVDVALLPPHACKEFPEARILTSYCISSLRESRNIILACDKPVQQLERIILDDFGPIGRGPVSYIARSLWRSNAEIVAREALPTDYVVTDNDGEIIVGDQALHQNTGHRYRIDLGEEWYRSTRLQLITGVWVAQKQISPEETDRSERTLTLGIEHTWEAIVEAGYESWPEAYGQLTETIDYLYDEQKEKALKKIWSIGLKVSPHANPG